MKLKNDVRPRIGRFFILVVSVTSNESIVFWLSSVYLGALIVRVPLVAVLTGTDRPVEGCGAECLGATHWETAGMGTSGKGRHK